MGLCKLGYKFVIGITVLGLSMSMGAFATEVENSTEIVDPQVIAIELDALEENDGLPPEFPMTKEDFAQVFLHIGKNNLEEYKVRLINARFDIASSPDFKQMIGDGYRIASGKYPEYMAFICGYNYRISSAGLGSNLTITPINDDHSHEKIVQMTDLFKIRVEGRLNHLKDEGKLTDEMTQREKAQAIYEWIIWNTAYDQEKVDISHTGYGLMENSFAVCEGYTATFNLMCRMEGIDIQGVVGGKKDSGDLTSHIWSVAELDGERVYVDATWGDPIGKSLPVDNINYAYFAISADKMAEDHAWDKDRYGY